jgi:Zn-dependent peptidase ImmA (M78 family)/transcriptional regulator with XRE-family HTH domain
MMAKVGKRLRKMRESVGLTLEEAAKLVGFRHFQTLHKIENEKRAIKIDELAALAKAYGFDLNFFLLDEPKPGHIHAFWRADPNPPTDRSHENRLQMFFERYLHLEDLLGISQVGSRIPKFDIPKMDYTIAAEYGEKYSGILKLGDRPALSLPPILENDYNLPIFYLLLPEGASAISIISNGNSAICVNQAESTGRQKFDIAHELFHLVYQKSISEECGTTDKSFHEKCANAFASALLLPQNLLEKEIKRRKAKTTFDLSALVVLAYEFGVSLPALVWRLVNLGRLQRKMADSILSSLAVKEIDRIVRQQESCDIPHISRRYTQMVFEAVSRGQMSKMRAAEYLDIHVHEIEAVFSRAGLILKESSDIEISVM